ncbi:putative Cytokinin dehydrogenase 11 [Cocos nucifera]|uniref:Putative Cytokinin dehydrogenase 11 n=1 Tax=Cocos nucifera TaxID=13894 RepID=A0A8K0N5D0_COCNU|nr:putative Cytokinin dehydrogenase 11 [Cocos nucifera]
MAVIQSATVDDVATIILLTIRSSHLIVVVSNNGHSINGQAMADGGLIPDMHSLNLPKELVGASTIMGGCTAIDVPGRMLQEEVLEWRIWRHGMVLASWMDYLWLTVCGMLSNDRISVQAF